jgi:hypothetical protein
MFHLFHFVLLAGRVGSWKLFAIKIMHTAEKTPEVEQVEHIHIYPYFIAFSGPQPVPLAFHFAKMFYFKIR